MYKEELGIISDRKLSFHWNTTTAEIRQLRTGKRKLSVARKLQIARALDLDPVQIFVSCEFYKAREDEKDYLKTVESTGQRNTLFQYLLWGFKVKCFSRSFI